MSFSTLTKDFKSIIRSVDISNVEKRNILFIIEALRFRCLMRILSFVEKIV